MRKSPFFVLLAVAALGIGASTASAARFTDLSAVATNGHIRQPSVGTGPIHGGLLVSFREVGVPGKQAVTYVVTADATATYVCFNRGSNHPKAANKQGVAGSVTGTATLTTDANGRVTGTLAVAPLGPGSFVCPSGQYLELADVSYTNVVIRDITNGVTGTIPGTFTRVFFALP